MSNIKTAEKLLIDISLLCVRKRKTKDEFLFDLKGLISNSITPIQFQNNWIELFNGTIRSFSSINSFLGSVRRAYNYGKKSRQANLKQFAIELEWSYKKPPLTIHLYKGFMKAKPPANFRFKVFLYFEFKQNLNGKLAFDNGYAYVNNWFSQIKQYILNDLPHLITSRVINPKIFMFGFGQELEVYNPKTQYYIPNHKAGSKSKISSTLSKLQHEVNLAIDNLDSYYTTLARSMMYFIHTSKLYITFYYI